MKDIYKIYIIQIINGLITSCDVTMNIKYLYALNNLGGAEIFGYKSNYSIKLFLSIISIFELISLFITVFIIKNKNYINLYTTGISLRFLTYVFLIINNKYLYILKCLLFDVLMTLISVSQKGIISEYAEKNKLNKNELFIKHNSYESFGFIIGGFLFPILQTYIGFRNIFIIGMIISILNYIFYYFFVYDDINLIFNSNKKLDSNINTNKKLKNEEKKENYEKIDEKCNKENINNNKINYFSILYYINFMLIIILINRFRLTSLNIFIPLIDKIGINSVSIILNNINSANLWIIYPIVNFLFSNRINKIFDYIFKKLKIKLIYQIFILFISSYLLIYYIFLIQKYINKYNIINFKDIIFYLFISSILEIIISNKIYTYLSTIMNKSQYIQFNSFIEFLKHFVIIITFQFSITSILNKNILIIYKFYKVCYIFTIFYSIILYLIKNKNK